MDAAQTENLRAIKNAVRQARVPEIIYEVSQITDGMANEPRFDHTTAIGRRMILREIEDLRELLDELETNLREAAWS